MPKVNTLSHVFPSAGYLLHSKDNRTANDSFSPARPLERQPMQPLFKLPPDLPPRKRHFFCPVYDKRGGMDILVHRPDDSNGLELRPKNRIEFEDIPIVWRSNRQ